MPANETDERISEEAVRGGASNHERMTLDVLRTRASVSVEEAADLLSLGRASAYAAAKRGEIPTVRIGRRLIVPASALLRMLEPEQPAASA